jgi:hypothetical protein
LTVEEFDTPWAAVAARILVDPADEGDVTTVNALQDQLAIEAKSSTPLVMPDYDTASLEQRATHCSNLPNPWADSTARSVRRATSTRFGIWSRPQPGLPGPEARYIGVEPALPVGEYKLTVREVPV